MAEAHASGLWVVTRGEKQWAAWEDWMRREFKRYFFPDRMTVIGEWPPETVEGARIVAAKINTIRDQIGLHRVRDTPTPWRPR